MKRLIILLIIQGLSLTYIEAQQIKRSTLTSVGKLKVADPFRVSWTAGSCPGCTVLHPADPPNTGYLRQGFQQPTFNSNASNCPSLTPLFAITPIMSPVCGTKFDMEYMGMLVPNLVVEWDFGVGAVPQKSRELNPTGVIYTVSGIKIITLKVSTDTNCVETRAKTITITNSQLGFAAQANVTDVKCRNEKTGSIRITSFGGTGTKTYRWSNGATTQNLTALGAGTYSVTTTDANGCAFTLDTAINQPTQALGFTNIITAETCKDYEDGVIELTPTGGTKPYKITWSTGAITPTISALAAGVYRFSVLDSNNCRLDSSILLTRRCRPQDTSEFQIFDVITPNGDDKNDKWFVANIERYPDNEIFIYNRWGQLVYTTKAYRNDWRGTNQDGEDLPTAAYYYIIRLNDDKKTVWDGSVTILR